MHRLADEERFEEAAATRDRLGALARALQRRRTIAMWRAVARLVVECDGQRVEIRRGRVRWPDDDTDAPRPRTLERVAGARTSPRILAIRRLGRAARRTPGRRPRRVSHRRRPVSSATPAAARASRELVDVRSSPAATPRSRENPPKTPSAVAAIARRRSANRTTRPQGRRRARRPLRDATGGRHGRGCHFAGRQHVAADPLSPRARRPGRGRASCSRAGRRDAHRRRAVRPRDLELVRPVPPPARGRPQRVVRRREALRDAASGGLADPSMPEMTEHAAVARLARSTARDDRRVGRREPRAGHRARGPRGRPDRVGRARTVRRRLRAVPRVLRVGDRPLLEHPEAVRHAPRGRAHRVRVRRRARVRVPHPLVPRRAGRERRVPRVAHRDPDRAPRVAAPDRRRPRLRRRSRTRPRQDRRLGRARDARADLRARARSAPVGAEARLRDRRRRRRGRAPRRRAPRRATPTHDEHRIVVDVLSTQRRYGRLAAINPNGVFFPQERVVLEAYARLAAAALDSAVRARRRPPPGPHRPRPPRPVELARPARHHRRDGREHRPRASPPSSAATAPRSPCSNPARPSGRVVATYGYSVERRRAPALDGGPGRRAARGRHRGHRLGPRQRGAPQRAAAADGASSARPRSRRSRSSSTTSASASSSATSSTGPSA